MEQQKMIFALLMAAILASVSITTTQGYLLPASLQEQLADMDEDADAMFMHEASKRQYPALPLVPVSLVRRILYEHELESEQVDAIVKDVIASMISYTKSSDLKRGWNNKFSIQARPSPFGTKLVPNKFAGKVGGTLLRYGRSVL